MRLSSASAATRHVMAAAISILKVSIPILQRQGEPHMTVTMEKEHLTEDLLKRLLASSSVERS